MTTKKSHRLKTVVKLFTKNAQKKHNKPSKANSFEAVTKRDEIVNWDDPMIDKDDQGAVLDSQQNNALTSKEKEIVAQMTNNKAAIEGISGKMSFLILMGEGWSCFVL